VTEPKGFLTRLQPDCSCAWQARTLAQRRPASTDDWCAQSVNVAAFQRRDLSQVDYVYLWADGVHFNIRLEHERLCCLVLVGVRADGRKELVAVGDGYRESTESWSELLRDFKRRGMRAPVLAIRLLFWLNGGRSKQIAHLARDVIPPVRNPIH
jgi:hypothetical protein